MQNLRTCFLLALAAMASLSPARPAVATFGTSDAAQAFGAGCGQGPKGKVHVHRDSTGGMLRLVGERQSEAVLYAESQACNKLQDDVINVWRNDQGQVSAQLIDRGDGMRLLIGENAEIRGKRFDVERTGQYLIVSLGTTSTISAVAKPYLKMAEVPLDAQRIFAREGSILVVGDNPATGRLEGRTVRILPTGLAVDPVPVEIAGMPAGVRVLDYSEESDDLLLSGVDQAGQPSFVLVNLTSGRSSAVPPLKPGDNMALFLDNSALRQRLSGAPAAADSQSPAGQAGGLKGLFKR